MGKGGEGTGDDGPNADRQISVLEDPAFQPFKDHGFSVADFTSRALAGSHTTAQAQSEALRDGLRVLESELGQEVTARHGELLGNVRRLLDAERPLGDVRLSVESLQSAVRRVRAEIVGPYEHIKARTRQLRNLHATVQLLRHLIHRLKLTQKLRAQMAVPAGGLDLAKAARLISDIRAVDLEVDLSAMDAVAGDAELLATAHATVAEQAEAMLAEGIESMSQAKVGSALQVYFNLEELPQVFESLMEARLHRVEKLARVVLDARHLNAGGSSQAGTWQDKLFSGLKELSEAVGAAAAAMWHLQRVVAKKKDPLTHVCFLDVLVPSGQPMIMERFWSSMVKVLSDAFGAMLKPGAKNGFVREALISGYPRLAATLETGFDRLLTETTIKGVTPAVGPEQLQQLLGATAGVQGEYLAKSLARMSDAVAAAFPGGMRALAAPADVQRCISVLHEELKAGSGSPQMAVLAVANATKALHLLAEKAEFMAAAGPDVRAVAPGAPATAAQARNLALAAQVQDVHRSLAGLLPRLPQPAAAALTDALDALQATALEVVAPIFRSVMEAVEERLLQIHTLDLSGESLGGMVATSGYVGEVAALLAHFRSEFLSKGLLPGGAASCVGALVERMAARTLIYFVRHASLVRPLGAGGRLQVAKDLAELQAAVGAALLPLDQLGPPYRVVKAFRSLLFSEVAGLAASSLLQELPPSVVAHHLLSRVDAGVQAPHERSGLTPLQYSMWLDAHTSEDAMRGMAAALATAPTAQLPPEQQEVLQIIQRLCQLTAG